MSAITITSMRAHTRGELEGDRADQSGNRVTAIVGGDGPVMVGQGIEDQDFDPVRTRDDLL
jgi:hypothetical protein